MMQSCAYIDDSGLWHVKRETEMISPVYLVYSMWLVERDKPDERNNQDKPVLPIPLSYPANDAFLVPTSDTRYLYQPRCRPCGIGGAFS